MTTRPGFTFIIINIRIAWLSYAEIKHSDWLKIVMGLGTANQSDFRVAW